MLYHHIIYWPCHNAYCSFFSLSVELNCISFSNAVVMLLTLKHSSSSITNKQLITRYVQTGIINVNINNN